MSKVPSTLQQKPTTVLDSAFMAPTPRAKVDSRSFRDELETRLGARDGSRTKPTETIPSKRRVDESNRSDREKSERADRTPKESAPVATRDPVASGAGEPAQEAPATEADAPSADGAVDLAPTAPETATEEPLPTVAPPVVIHDSAEPASEFEIDLSLRTNDSKETKEAPPSSRPDSAAFETPVEPDASRTTGSAAAPRGNGEAPSDSSAQTPTQALTESRTKLPQVSREIAPPRDAASPLPEFEATREVAADDAAIDEAAIDDADGAADVVGSTQREKRVGAPAATSTHEPDQPIDTTAAPAVVPQPVTPGFRPRAQRESTGAESSAVIGNEHERATDAESPATPSESDDALLEDADPSTNLEPAANASTRLAGASRFASELGKVEVKSAPAGVASTPAQTTGIDGVTPKSAADAARILTAPPAPANVPVQQILAQVQRAVRAGMHELRIRLDPPSLGSLTLKFAMEGDSLTVHVRASRPEVVEALKNDLAGFADTLSKAGIDLTSLDVSLDADHGGDASSFQEKLEDAGARDPLAANARTNSRGTKTVERSVATSALLDVMA